MTLISRTSAFTLEAAALSITDVLPADVLSTDDLDTAAFPGTLPDNLMEAFAQAGPTISYRRPLDRMMVDNGYTGLGNQRQAKVTADFR